MESLLTTEIHAKNGYVPREIYEELSFREMGSIKSNQSMVVKDILDKDNNMYILTTGAQSKGGIENIGFIFVSIGQAALNGRLIPFSITNQRTLPYYSKQDETPPARGYMIHNYTDSLTFPEFVFHNMDGRTGLIDTAIKTGEIGYLQRRLTKGMEDIGIDYRNIVRDNSHNNILQFIYGNGYDLIYTMSNHSSIMKMSEKELKKIFPEKKIYEYVQEKINYLQNTIIYKSINRSKFNNEIIFPILLPEFLQKFNHDYKTSQTKQKQNKKQKQKQQKIKKNLYTKIQVFEKIIYFLDSIKLVFENNGENLMKKRI